MEQAILNKYTAGGIRLAILHLARHLSDQSAYGDGRKREIGETLEFLRKLANDIEAGKQ